MPKGIIDYKKVSRELALIRKDIEKREDIATTRALNVILKEERKEIGDEIAAEYGLKKTSVRKKISPVKATRQNKNVKLIMQSSKVNLPQARKIKGGISFKKKGGGRSKIKVNIRSGSKPFVIKAKAGGVHGGDDIETKGGVKKIPVFVPAAFNKYKKIKQRKVKTLKGLTIRGMALEQQIDNKRLEKRIIKRFPAEYKKQLPRAKYTGKR